MIRSSPACLRKKIVKWAQSVVGLSLLAQNIWRHVEFTLKRIWTQLNMHVEETTSTEIYKLYFDIPRNSGISKPMHTTEDNFSFGLTLMYTYYILLLDCKMVSYNPSWHWPCTFNLLCGRLPTMMDPRFPGKAVPSKQLELLNCA
jgi:hypothetical protein